MIIFVFLAAQNNYEGHNTRESNSTQTTTTTSTSGIVSNTFLENTTNYDFIVKTDEVGAAPIITDAQTLENGLSIWLTTNSRAKENAISVVNDAISMQEEYNVNAVFIYGLMMAESTIGTANTSWVRENNWCSLTALGHIQYETPGENMKKMADLIANGSYYFNQGKYSVYTIGEVYCADPPPPAWADHVSGFMTALYEALGYNIEDIISGNFTNTNAVTRSGLSGVEGICFDFFLQKNCTPKAAVSILGNIKKESEFDSALEREGAIGLCQWKGERAQTLKAYAEDRGTDWTDLNLQLNFIWLELNAESDNTIVESQISQANYESLFKATNINKTTLMIIRDYLDVDGQENGERINNARDFYKQYLENLNSEGLLSSGLPAEINNIIMLSDEDAWFLLTGVRASAKPNVSEAEMDSRMTTIQVQVWDWEDASDSSNLSKVNKTKNLTINSALKVIYEAIFKDIYDQGIIIHELGGYCYRLSTDGSDLSAHAYGAAVDINWSTTGNRFSDTPLTEAQWRSLPETHRKYEVIYQNSPLVQIMHKYTMCWGGDWRRPHDAMHFSFIGDRTREQIREDTGYIPGNAGDTDITGVSSITIAGHTYPHYLQEDTRWANNRYGSSNIGRSGCGPTSLAMIVSGLTGTTVTPDKLVNNLYQYYNGRSPFYTPGVGSNYGSLCDSNFLRRYYNLVSVNVDGNTSRALTYLRAGIPIIARESGHILAALPIPSGQSGNFYILDSARGHDGAYSSPSDFNTRANTSGFQFKYAIMPATGGM